MWSWSHRVILLLTKKTIWYCLRNHLANTHQKKIITKNLRLLSTQNVIREMMIEITELRESNTTTCTKEGVSHVPTPQAPTPLLCPLAGAGNITTGIFPTPKRRKFNIKGVAALGTVPRPAHLLSTATNNTLISIAKGVQSIERGNRQVTPKNSRKKVC